jgi:hypothetical protein
VIQVTFAAESARQAVTPAGLTGVVDLVKIFKLALS